MTISPVLLYPGHTTPAAPPPAAPPAPSGLVDALDVSSNNGADIAPLLDRYTPHHLITKLYQSIELGGQGWRYSVDHANTAHAKGLSVGGYVWLYAGIDGSRQVADALETARKANIRFGPTNPLWLDCETYTDGSYPSVAIVRQAVAECARRGVPCGIYTGGWFWRPYMGNTAEFAALPLWASVYDERTVMVEVDFGGWRALAGKQWSGSPIDRSVFRAAFATEGREG